MSTKVKGRHGRSARCCAKGLIGDGASQRISDANGIGAAKRIGPGNVDALAAGSGERALHAVPESRTNSIVKNGKRQRAARAEDAFLGDAQEQLQTFRAAVEFCGEQFFVIEQIEHRVGNAESAAELSPAAVKGNPLLTNFLETNGNVGGVAAVVQLDLNVLSAYGFEVAGKSKFREADFERVVIERVALAEGNAAPHEAVVEFVQTLEFDAVDKIRWRIRKIEL